MMADFPRAFAAVVDRWEGRLSRNRLDPGGMTYKGRSRASHPTWPGWTRIDALSKLPGFPGNLEADVELQRMLKDSYRAGEWGDIRGSEIPSQPVADEMLDQATLEGPGTAITLLQYALNACNKGGVLYADVKLDGGFGDRTMEALITVLAKGRERTLTKTLNVLQGFYLLVGRDLLDYLKAHPTPAWREEFWSGWLERISV